VTQEALEQLFGKGHLLRVHRPLYQDGHFAAEETVTIIGPRQRMISNLRILGRSGSPIGTEGMTSMEAMEGANTNVLVVGGSSGMGLALAALALSPLRLSTRVTVRSRAPRGITTRC
jgi:hypothetical protein